MGTLGTLMELGDIMDTAALAALQA